MCVQPERGWEVDVDDLAARADDDTSCIVFNNPSNPCGSVYSRRHLRDILRVAERLRLPIIADEIYADFVSAFVSRHAFQSRQLFCAIWMKKYVDDLVKFSDIQSAKKLIKICIIL